MRRRLLVGYLLFHASATLASAQPKPIIFPFWINGHVNATPAPGQLESEAWRTGLNLSNRSNSVAEVEIEIFDSEGQQVNTRDLLIPAPPLLLPALGNIQVAFLIVDPPGPFTTRLQSGWLRVTSSQDVVVSENISRVIRPLSINPMLGRTLESIEIPPPRGTTKAQMFVGSVASTGIALLHPSEGGEAIQGKITLLDAKGLTLSERAIELEPNFAVVKLLTDFLQLPAGTLIGGSAIIDFSQAKTPIYVSAIRWSADGRLLVPAHIGF